MEKGKLRISPKLISLLVAGGIALTPIAANGVTNNSYDPGTFVKWVEEEEGAEFGMYIVITGDNASHISEKICSHLRMEITAKYWPLVKYYNPNPLHEGDVIFFPLNPNKIEEKYAELCKTGWKAKYIQTHDVYKKKTPKRISVYELGKLLEDMYPGVCIDPDFIHLFLEYKHLDEKYILSVEGSFDDNTLNDFAESIPDLADLLEYRNEHKPKTKVKR